jgi:hypothetical protein
LLRGAIRYKFARVEEVLAASIIKAMATMLEAVSTSEMSVNFYWTTQHNKPEDSHLQTGRDYCWKIILRPLS